MTATQHPGPMNEITTQILAFFLRFGYGSVFVGVMLDNAGIPIPGELVLILTGYMVENGVSPLPRRFWSQPRGRC